MTVPIGEWVEDPTITINGTPVAFPAGSWAFGGPVIFLPSNDAGNTGTGILILGPGAGAASFPAVDSGPAGPPATMSFTVSPVAYGTTLPSPNPAVVNPSPGVYDLTIYLNEGAPGSPGTYNLQGSQDVSGTATVGYVPVITSLTGGGGPHPLQFQWQPELGSGGYYSTTGGAATASNTTSPKNLTAIGIAPRPYAWWPECKGQALTVGASDTRVDYTARINSTSGQIVGYGLGQAGAAPCPTGLIDQGLNLTGPQIVPANTAATIYFNAENQTSSINPWSVAAGWFFSVKVIPVPTT